MTAIGLACLTLTGCVSNGPAYPSYGYVYGDSGFTAAITITVAETISIATAALDALIEMTGTTATARDAARIIIGRAGLIAADLAAIALTEAPVGDRVLTDRALAARVMVGLNAFCHRNNCLAPPNATVRWIRSDAALYAI